MSDIEYVGRSGLMKFLIIATGATILLLILVLITTFQSKADINKLKELNQEVQSLKEGNDYKNSLKNTT
jgi:signal transduction histidine kinase